MSGGVSPHVRALVEENLKGVAQAVDRYLPPHPALDRTPRDQYRHLLEETQELYENELLWEEESDEEDTGAGTMAELVFPGTLALVDALATSHTPNERGEGSPHRDVVFGFLQWLVERSLTLRSPRFAGGSRRAREKRIELTERLIELVVYRYYGLSAEEIERIEATNS